MRTYIENYIGQLRIRNFSENTIDAYRRDLIKYLRYSFIIVITAVIPTLGGESLDQTIIS